MQSTIVCRSMEIATEFIRLPFVTTRAHLIAIILGMIVLIPVLAILIDSPLSEALARRIASKESAGSAARLDAIEKEMEYLTQAVESLRDEATFVRSLVEGREPGAALPPPGPSSADPAGEPESTTRGSASVGES